jgi:hypothetical protein
MNRNIACAALVGAFLTWPVHAYTISAEGLFDVVFAGMHGEPPIDPPLTGSGFFDIRENRITDFEFTMLGVTWTENDLPSTRCLAEGGVPHDSLCSALDLPNGFILDTIAFSFDSPAGGGFLLWDFVQGIFSINLLAGDVGFGGTNESDNISSRFHEFTSQINVPEPGTLLLLALGLLGLAVVRRFDLQAIQPATGSGWTSLDVGGRSA